MDSNLTAIIRSAIRDEQSAFYQMLTQQLALHRQEHRQDQAELRQEVANQFSSQRLFYDARFNELETTLSAVVTQTSANSSQVSQNSESSFSSHASSTNAEGDEVDSEPQWNGKPKWGSSAAEAPSAQAPGSSILLGLPPPNNPLTCLLCRVPFLKKRRV